MKEFIQELVKMELYCSFLECEKVRLTGVNNQNMGDAVTIDCFYLYIRFYVLVLYFTPSDTVIIREVQAVIIVA